MSMLKQQLNDFSQIVRGRLNADENGFDNEKSQIYQELLLNNFNSLISPCFPVLRSILPSDLWHKIVKDIFSKANLQKNIFHQIAFELVNELELNPLVDYPFAFELAHYEWLELELELKANDLNIKPFNKELDVLNHEWQISSCAVIKQYQYDVHNIGQSYQPKDKIKTNLIVYKKNDTVEFIKLTEQSSQLLECILYEELAAKEIIAQLCSLYDNLNQASLLKEAENLLVMLYQEQIIYRKHLWVSYS